jgi:hypothetical protein
MFHRLLLLLHEALKSNLPVWYGMVWYGMVVRPARVWIRNILRQPSIECSEAKCISHGVPLPAPPSRPFIQRCFMRPELEG